jgi:hypothetical protein
MMPNVYHSLARSLFNTRVDHSQHNPKVGTRRALGGIVVSVAGLPKDYLCPTKRSRGILRTPPNAFVQPTSGKVGVLGSP